MTSPATILGYLLSEPVLHVRVAGAPAPQGSKSFKGMTRNGRAILAESAVSLKPWRDKVQAAFEDAMGDAPLLIDGPAAIDTTFTVRKPASAPKRRRTWPIRRPDGDKLTRAIWDAATAAGVWVEDSRAVEWSGRKVFPGEHPDALLLPGVVIRVYRVVDM